jgi:hypothetical protein
MSIYRKFRVNYTPKNMVMQKIVVEATDVNAAREIVRQMFPGAMIGYIEVV